VGERIIAVVGARLNSSRLPKKHFLSLAGKPLIERLWERLAKVDRLTEIVLATTDDSYNEPLKEWAETTGRKCVAYQGAIDDLMGRVDSVVKQFDTDILVYVCGDCPLVEPSAIDRMLDQIEGQPEIDTVGFSLSANGDKVIHEGFDVFRRGFWDRMVSVASAPFEKEHVGAVYHHLKKVMPTAKGEVLEPEEYYGTEHRISVDTPSDYRFMRRVYVEWYSGNGDETIVDLKHVIDQVKEEPGLRCINEHVYQKTIRDTSIKAVIVTESGPKVGMGHLMRMLVATAALQDYLGANVKLIIKGAPLEIPDLALVNHSWISELTTELWQEALENSDLLIFDLKEKLDTRFEKGPQLSKKCMTVGIDLPMNDATSCDLVWLPTFFTENAETFAANDVRVGWDCFLLKDSPLWRKCPDSPQQKKVLVLSGGSDAAGLGETLPEKMLRQLPADVRIDWVQGPYASEPIVSCDDLRDRFNILFAPTDLPSLFSEYDAVMCVYGVSYFECLRAGIPTVVFDAVGAAQPGEWQQLKKLFPDNVALDGGDAISKLAALLLSCPNDLHDDIAFKLRQGSKNFVEEIAARIIARTEISKKVG
tara:strand:+ start:156 stop:1928 length:1773 start_codon:yes stop_codon:yes gene_type:complete